MASNPRNVFLIGYRCTGKSAVGQLLAERLGFTFIDSDGTLEQTTGQTIPTIFAEQGEAGFRELESQILRKLVLESCQVVATGGGVVLRPENRDLLCSHGIVIWLDAEIETIWKRMQQDQKQGKDRPKLTRGGKEEIEELKKSREPIYRSIAQCRFETDARTPHALAELIAAWLAQS